MTAASSAWFAVWAAVAVAWEQHSDLIIRGAGLLIALGVMWRYAVLPPVRFFKRIEKAVLAVEAQLLTKNGGSTTRDQLDDIQRRLKALEERNPQP